MVSSRSLATIIISTSFIALVQSQSPQGVSWETAPECPDSGGGTAVDTVGRTWGWYNGQSCKHSKGTAPSQQQQQASWDAAPPCSYAATADNSKSDSQGRLWGWQNGASCRHTGGVTTTTSSSPPLKAGPPSPPAVSWDAAPPCSYKPTVANSRTDNQGRYWGWQTGVGSCRFNEKPQNVPLPPPPPRPLTPTQKKQPVTLPPAAAAAVPQKKQAAPKTVPQLIPVPSPGVSEGECMCGAGGDPQGGLWSWRYKAALW